jgi:hypothetical protein
MEVITKQLKMPRNSHHIRLYLPRQMVKQVGLEVGNKLRLIPKNDEIYLVKSNNNLGKTIYGDYSIDMPVRFNDKYYVQENEYIHIYVDGGYIRLKFARGQTMGANINCG